MKMGKQVVTALALVASLGFVVPSTLGGSVSADISHNPNLNLDDPFPMACDLDGDSNDDTTYVPSHYETTYNFLSTANSRVFHDPNSNTVMTQRERIDVLQAEYVPLPPEEPGDPEGTYLLDTEVEWFDEFFADDIYPHGKPKGRKTVRCVNIADPYEWTIPAEEAVLESRLVEGATYLETDWQLFEVMLSASGKAKAQAQHKHKGGKHRHHKRDHKHHSRHHR